MTLRESINWFLIAWIGLFGMYCLDASQQRWFGSWNLKTALLVSGIIAAGAILAFKLSQNGLPDWFYRLYQLLK